MAESNNEAPIEGVPPDGTYNVLQRKRQSLWVVGLVIVLPLIVLLLLFLLRVL